MELKKQPNSFYLFKLAFRSAKFSGKHIFVTLFLLSLFVAGSLYITNRLCKRKLPAADKTGLNKGTASTDKAPKSPLAGSNSETQVKPLSLSAEYWQKRKQNGINRLSSQLHASAKRTIRRAGRTNKPRAWKDKKAATRIARQESALIQPDEVKAIQQDQLVFSEPATENDVPPPPKSKPGFWGEVGKDFIAAMKTMLNAIL